MATLERLTWSSPPLYRTGGFWYPVANSQMAVATRRLVEWSLGWGPA